MKVQKYSNIARPAIVNAVICNLHNSTQTRAIIHGFHKNTLRLQAIISLYNIHSVTPNTLQPKEEN